MVNELKLDLGCGRYKKEGFYGIDRLSLEGVDRVMDLMKFPWDIASESADEIYCSHLIEHVPHDVHNPNDERDGLIQFMNEIYRVLKPGGKVTIHAPYYTSVRAFGDPTHTRYICDWTFYYFNKEWREGFKLDHYGIEANFDMTLSYKITNEMTLKSEEVRNKAFTHDWNVIDDIIVELTKI